jgi:metal-responsive CopG/Arc/MetJ family transcriptional regulator
MKMRNNTHDAVVRTRISKELLEKLTETAKEQNYSISEIVREAIRRIVK